MRDRFNWKWEHSILLLLYRLSLGPVGYDMNRATVTLRLDIMETAISPPSLPLEAAVSGSNRQRKEKLSQR
jgi:hypothetical protein